MKLGEQLVGTNVVCIGPVLHIVLLDGDLVCGICASSMMCVAFSWRRI